MNIKNNKNDFNFWRKLINAWSFFFFAVIIIDFIYTNAFKEILNAIATIYISILAIYVSNKEFERWYDQHEDGHPGEIFVIIWSVLVGVLFILDIVYGKTYELPGAIVSTYIAVLTILVITRKSKELYKLKRSNTK
ncbi:hypothetical protein CVU82_01240 [Candidatus Falkowbacteria bacterium HGW-Falkowbacteria-1]|uniref:Uncharacterized protein n=1 Tax=Candidatus Falkowbacteria bacterium HGW-Falkowbacteria-1 TaxID=2013768 RepID=A0A2N2EAP8_9BACT|nr:MAG: hypothetical protein CVU82_01240 [Candidatus Falkowbacteria bacterium HGW-Falkowbacteria-1]